MTDMTVSETDIKKAGWWPARIVKVTDQTYATSGVSVPVSDGKVIAVLGITGISSNVASSIATAEVVTGNKIKFSATTISNSVLATAEISNGKTVSYTAAVLIE